MLLADDDGLADVSGEDLRSSDLRSLERGEAAGMEALRKVFIGTNLLKDAGKVRRILRARTEIQKEWGDARDSFLAIGRALLSLEDDLSRTEFARLRQGTEQLFPFSDATATQLRQIARAVDGGRIPLEACPGSYGTAYQITLLSDEQMRVATQRGLLRSDVTRREIMQLRREVSPEGTPDDRPAGRVDQTRLRQERVRLVDRRDRLADELTILTKRITELDSLLSPIVDPGTAEVD